VHFDPELVVQAAGIELEDGNPEPPTPNLEPQTLNPRPWIIT
jgi:hypothetical protein